MLRSKPSSPKLAVVLGVPLSLAPKLSVSDMELGPGTDTMNPKLPLPTGAENSLNANGSQGMLAKVSHSLQYCAFWWQLQSKKE